MISENIETVKQNIEVAAKKSGRKPEDITLIAVTKTVEVARILEAVNCGLCELGENRVQELEEKFPQIPNVNWHLIGHLQTNKVKYLKDKVKLIHSVDSIKLANEINRVFEKPQEILAQINISNEESKFGMKPDDIYRFIEECEKMDNVRVRGIMTILPLVCEEYQRHKFYEQCYKIFLDIKAKTYYNSSMKYLSMGMTNDYNIAIEEGANIVRVGTGIFGNRIYK